MAELSRFLGIVVAIFTRGEGDDDASVAIDGGRVIAGSLRAKDLWLVRHWMAQHKAELHEAWAAAVSGKKPRKIPPLRGKR